MSKHLTALQHELERTQRELETLRLENKRLSLRDTSNQQTPAPDHVNPERRKPIMDALSWITLVSIVVVGGLTYWGIRKEEENKLLPIVVLGTRDDYTDKEMPKHTIVIRNVGFGPALNSVTREFVVRNESIQLNHRTSIEAGETQDIEAERKLGVDKPYDPISIALGTPPLKRATLAGDLQNEIGGETVPVCIGYESALGEWYETRQIIHVTAQGELAIDFASRPKRGSAANDVCAVHP